jgi:hypothetical protein
VVVMGDDDDDDDGDGDDDDDDDGLEGVGDNDDDDMMMIVILVVIDLHYDGEKAISVMIGGRCSYTDHAPSYGEHGAQSGTGGAGDDAARTYQPDGNLVARGVAWGKLVAPVIMRIIIS